VLSIIVGFVAGFIDSIAGGGGLITLPYLTLLLVEPAHAVGTNKIVGTLGALTAYVIYQRKNKIDWREGLAFCLTVGAGSWVGSKITPHIPAQYFVIGLLLVSPLILWIVLSKDLFIKERVRGKKMQWPAFVAAFLVGIYDGGFGPGGGTFMLLALLLVAKLPLLHALTLSKLSNTLSAGTALVSFASGGYVHWQLGLSVGASMIAGAFVGSHTTTKHTTKIVRPIMIVVVLLLIATLVKKLLIDQYP
jgi:uncharacterized membrane protein YfcA